jgi:uncharacterized protein
LGSDRLALLNAELDLDMNGNISTFGAPHALGLALLLGATAASTRSTAIAQPAGARATPVSWEEIQQRWQARARAEVESAAENGDLTAQHYLGRLHLEGLDGKTNLEEGIKWYRRAAESGFPNAQNNLGLAHLHGVGVKVDLDEAVRLLGLAAGQGLALSKRNLAIALAHKESTPERWLEVRNAHEDAARGGDVSAMIELAHFLLNPPQPGQPREDANARYWLLKAYERGRTGLCSNIGWTYGDTVDPEMALRWFRRGIEREADPHCELSFGWMLLTGRGIQRNVEEGMKWTLKAAEKGLSGAQVNLGRVYEQSEPDLLTGERPDYRAAEKWFRLAEAQGDIEAKFRLGRLALAGKVRTSRKQIVEWLQTAAEAGHRPAVSLLKQAQNRP